MLKLLKYEWKACARICLPLYAVELLVAFINRLLYSDIGSKLLYIPGIVADCALRNHGCAVRRDGGRARAAIL